MEFKEEDICEVVSTHLRNFRMFGTPDEVAAKRLAKYIKGLLNFKEETERHHDKALHGNTHTMMDCLALLLYARSRQVPKELAVGLIIQDYKSGTTQDFFDMIYIQLMRLVHEGIVVKEIDAEGKSTYSLTQKGIEHARELHTKSLK